VSASTVRFVRYPGESAQIIFAPLLLARERGYFRDEGLDVEVIEPPDHPWQCVARDDGDAGVGYIDYGGQPIFRGRFKAVAVQERLTAGRGLPALLARPQLIDDGTLRDESGLRGRAIGLSGGRGDDYLTFAFPLRRAGLSLADVQIVPVPHEGAARDAALERGAIDVIIGRRPRGIALEESRGLLRRWLVAGEIEPDWQNRFIIFGTEFIKRAPAAGRAFLRAHQRGVADYLAGTRSGKPSPEFLPELCRLSMETPELLTNCAPGGFPVDPRIDVAGVERDVALLRDAELFPAGVAVDELIDLTFAPEAAVR